MYRLITFKSPLVNFWLVNWEIVDMHHENTENKYAGSADTEALE